MNKSIRYLTLIHACTCLKQTTPKFCVNCKHFIPHEYNNEYGKCAFFVYENSKFLVDGIARENEYYTCSTARSSINLCGKEGTKYRKKYTKKIVKLVKN